VGAGWWCVAVLHTTNLIEKCAVVLSFLYYYLFISKIEIYNKIDKGSLFLLLQRKSFSSSSKEVFFFFKGTLFSSSSSSSSSSV
jgi:hypothetical protein